jgi:DNA-binding protein HU-beta
MVTFTVQAKAQNLSQTSQLQVAVGLKPSGAGKLTQVISIPTHGVNEKGEVVQTIQVTGLFTPATASESIAVSVTEAKKRALRSIVGVVQLVKVKLQVVSQTTPPNLKTTKATATKATATKATAAKAAAAKAAAAKKK